MRVAVYCDLRYQRRDGAVYCDESFARFVAGLADWTERLVLIGRLDTACERPFQHRVRDGVELQALEDYTQLSSTAPAVLALLRSLVPVWRLLGTVDSVWLLGPHPFAVACAALARARRRPVVLGVRENLPAYVALRHRGRWPRLVAWALDATWLALSRVAPVVVVGGELAERYRHACEVVPIAVSLVSADELPDAAYTQPRDYGGELDVLSVGRLDPEKNPVLLADVLAALGEPRWRLVVCGSGSMEPELRARLAALGADRRAELRGVVGPAELRARYAAAHALLHVSFSEGVPQVLFEAWAAGLPVVATDVGGVGDVARGAALLIPPADADAAAQALERIATDAGLRHRLSEAGFERVRRHAGPVECRRIADVLATRRESEPIQRNMWLWAVVGPDTRRIAAIGDAGLSASVRECGFDGVDATRPDAVIVGADGRAGRQAVRAAAEQLGDSALIAATFGGGRPTLPDAQPRVARAAELLSSPLQAAVAAARARALADELRRRGLRVATLATGERTRAYGLGPGGWRQRRRLPVGRVVVAARAALPPSVADAAVAQAAAALGSPLRRTGMTVTESGKLMVYVVDTAGVAYLVRIAGGPARPLLEQSVDRLAQLAAAGPGRELRARVAWPLGNGTVAAATWVLEPRADGRPAGRLSARLWRQCLDLLVELHTFDRCPAGADAIGALTADAAAIGAQLDAPRATALAQLAERACARLTEAPLGWVHGDFWNENLLVRRGRVEVILDWDWADRRSLPMLDLLDLIASSERRTRGLRPGPRVARVLLPLLRSGGDERIRTYCARTGTPADARTLEAIALAYWLRHVARYLLDPPATRSRAWLTENVIEPLGEFREQRR